MKIVVDTNVFIGALRQNDGVNREILRQCFVGLMDPVMGDALYYEYHDVMHRSYLFEDSNTTEQERHDFFDDFCSISEWIDIYYRWRPNLRDEADNHVVELARAAGAHYILSWNKKDFKNPDLLMPDLQILTPVEWIKTSKKRHN